MLHRPGRLRPAQPLQSRAAPDGHGLDRRLDWRRCPDGALRAECGPLRVMVRPPADGAYARFTVRRALEDAAGQGPRRGALVASGTQDKFEVALHDAEAAAWRAAALAGAAMRGVGHLNG